ncbi:MAG: ABC transporter ATP-binding protein [Candidatus Muiribacteriota bacterium]
MIEVKNLEKVYKVKSSLQPGFPLSLFYTKTENFQALKKINLNIKKGAFTGYIGMNGAGKTTTMKILSGILYPDGGLVKVNGFTPFKREKEFLRQIGFLMGRKNQLWWNLSPLETFRLHAKIYNIAEKEFKKRVDYFISILNLQKHINQPVRKLSLGQRMKCEIISSFIHYPQIVLLDEPCIGLDLVSKKEMYKFLRDYNREFGATIILTSHDMNEIENLCSDIIIIDKGKKLFDGKLVELKSVYGENNNNNTKLEEIVFNIYKKQLTLCT